MDRQWNVSGGAVLGEEGFCERSVHIAEGTIVVDGAAGARQLDATGLLVLPGLIDIHGDAFERQIMPRPKVVFDKGIALRDSDHQLVANGVTTAFHALTISWEPGLRSLESATEIVEAWKRARPALDCDTRLHLRWETFAFNAVEQVEAWLALDPAPILAFNDHTTSYVRKSANPKQLERIVGRTGMTREAWLELLQSIWAQRGRVPDMRRRLAEAAKSRGVVVLAHDETSPEERDLYRGLGADSSEFPLTFETAAAARQAGEHVILGAPNVVLGGSQTGAICATEAIERRLCTVLASDYYYPALLHAPFKLADPAEPGFGAAWDLVSKHAAEAAGLPDRGELCPGKRADLILVDGSDRAYPSVEAVMVAGRLIYDRRGRA